MKNPHFYLRTPVAILLLGFIGSGCATVRRARDAQRSTNVPPGERTVTAAEAGLNSNTVLRLDEALRIALAYHPTVTQARQNLVAATALLGEAKAAYLPAVNASAGYRKATANVAGAPENGHAKDSYSGALDADLLVFDFGKTPAAVRQARAQALAAAETLQAVRSDVAFAVRTAFFDLGRAEALRQVAEDAVRQFQEHLDQVKAYEEVGRRIRYDVTKAEVDLGNAQLDLINAVDAVTTSRAALDRSLGLAEAPGYAIGDVPAEEISHDAGQLMALARERHPELRALRAEESAASSAVDEAIAGLYPSLNLAGEYGANGSHFPLTWNWFGALASSLGIFSGWQQTDAIDEAVAEFRTARSKVADREQQIHLELSQALSQLDTARKRLDLTALIAREAEESLNLVREQYKLGKASAVDVTDAQVALTRAQADQVGARFDNLTAIAQIKHTIGEE